MNRVIRGAVALTALGLSLAGCGGGTTTTGGCTQSSDCQPGTYCSDGACKPKIGVGACADGTGHLSNDVCANGICLGGSCCVAKCLQGDPGCGAVACDPAKGTCILAPDGGPCGKEDCSNGRYTPSSTCDGTGLCRLVTPSQCDSDHCTGTQCTPACAQSSECDGGYCAQKICVPKLQNGIPCDVTSTSAADEACTSNVCLGRCCAATCPSSAVACAATACDATGACIYPGAEVLCGTKTCKDSATQTPAPICDAGGCQVLPDVPCQPFACNSSAGDCYIACNSAAATCDPSGYCLDQVCATKEDAGAVCAATTTSTADQACKSSLCSGGFCCLQSCPETPFTHCVGPCDATGACVTQTCQSGFGCVASTADCAVTCQDNSTCDTDHFCIPSMFGPGSCCPFYKPGDTLYIDGAAGNDFTACCGTAAKPCQTLTKAMSLINAAKISGVKLNAFRSDTSVNWTNRETWPVHLGWGITLDAPGIFFSLPSPFGGNSTKNNFEVYSYGALDTGTVTIAGGATDATYSTAVHIGFSSTNGRGGAISGVVDPPAGKTPVPLHLSSVWVATLPTGVAGPALDVGSLATVVLGPLPVLLGNPTGASNPVTGILKGLTGLSCQGAGATVSDDPTATGAVLLSANNTTTDLEIASGCQLTLTQGPAIGLPPVSGFCDKNPPGDTDGLHISGGSTVVFGSQALPGTIQCCRDNGVSLDTSDGTGSPTVTLDHVSISGAGCAAAYVGEGTLTATASSFTQNQLGVWVDANALQADLSGGDTMTCNGASSIAAQNGGCTALSQPPVGMDLLNSTAALGVNAQGATWDNWDGTAGQTQVWSCSDTSYTSCTCTGPNCPGGGATSLPDDADAVFVSTNTSATPIDSSVGTATLVCP